MLLFTIFRFISFGSDAYVKSRKKIWGPSDHMLKFHIRQFPVSVHVRLLDNFFYNLLPIFRSQFLTHKQNQSIVQVFGTDVLVVIEICKIQCKISQFFFSPPTVDFKRVENLDVPRSLLAENRKQV